jgi:hypothetical protein
MGIVIVGIYLARSVFAVHGDDGNGKAVSANPKVARTVLIAMNAIRARP